MLLTKFFTWYIVQDKSNVFNHCFKDTRIKEDELRHVFGIQSTNGANIHFKDGFGAGVGVFPIQAYLNHSCRYESAAAELLPNLYTQE